ncbi:PIR Superfamily Protein [Plasmodium ovale wallikeri]|uniref:PIR Superfamily Protein n=1 Tax=Plasmodium ovale wallikeri TaxID=864142 RepID=A0A1A9ADB8_PLAOA|nr:PIR Superfamily Protein [Plasmodium ovale wallikeri]
MDDWEKTLSPLTSYQVYEKFNNSSTFPGVCTYCTNMSSFERKYHGITKFCCEMEKNLINLNKILGNIQDRTERCRYFNFWFYYQIWKRFTSTQIITYSGSLINRLTYAWGDINKKLQLNECSYFYHDNISLDKWKEMKDLHDFFKNYNFIETNILTFNDKCQSYKNYIEYNDRLYKKYHTECCISKKNNKENYFNCDTQFNPGTLLSKLRCEDYISKPPEDHQIAHVEDNPDEGASSPISTATVPVVAGSFTVFTILSSLFIMYKFTPFGPRITNRIFSKSRIWNNTEEETGNHELISHISMDQETELGDKGYTLAYHSL